jgi:hypothetical protein
MIDISTWQGVAQAVGMGLALLAYLALRARRYRTDVVKAFMPLWLAVGVGIGVYSSVELGLTNGEIAMGLPVILLLPILAAIAARHWLGLRAPGPKRGH